MMLVTTSDVASLDALLSWWENAEYLAEAFVILGCAGEFLAEFTKIRTEEWRHLLSKISLLVLIAGLAVELGALVRTNSLSGQEIALLNTVAAEARTRAANAEGTAKGFESRIADSNARVKVAEAQIASANAASKDAVAKVSSAEARSAEASAKAESFRLDIAKANESAAKAEARAAEANLELGKLKTPRSLEPAQQKRMIARLLPFKGQEFAIYVFQDQESVGLLNVMGEILKSAQWVLQSPDSDLVVGKAGISLMSGVRVEAAPSRFAGLRNVGQTFADALASAGVPCRYVAEPEREKHPNWLHIVIGKKQ